MFSKNFCAIFAALLILSHACIAADLNYPYARINLKVPPAESPYPGLGDYYSAIDRGTGGSLWNPASLGKLKLSEGSVFIANTAANSNISRDSKYKEPSGTFEVGAGSATSKAAMSYALLLRPPSSVTGLSTKEVDITSSINSATTATGIKFSAAHRINDWLIIGLSSTNPLEGDTEIAGSFPLTARTNLDLYGKTMGGLKVTAAGKLSYAFTSGGTLTTLETTTGVWGGFLSQEVTIPFTALTELRNNVQLQSPYVGTVASQFGKFYAGLNIVPISATAQIDNDIRTVVNADSPDQFLYIPNFDPNNLTDSGNWFLDPNKYGSQAGYSRKQIRVPAGEIVADARYRGYYSGSTARMDLGIMYDITEWVTVGTVMENFGSATLNLKGSGISNYINYRNIDTTGTDNLLTPGQDAAWDPFTDTWVTTTEVSGTKLSLEPEKNYALPKKIRYGIALKRPFLIAVDYEQNQVPIVLSTSPAMTISDLSFIRFGAESQLFTLPYWMRIGMTLILKPTVTGADASTQSSINTAFKYRVLPVRLDMGSTLGLWGYDTDLSFGLNAMPVISMLQLDSSNIDLNNMLYYSVSLKKDMWSVNYLSQADLLSSTASYQNKPAGADGKKTIEVSDIKFVQTLGVKYVF